MNVAAGVLESTAWVRFEYTSSGVKYVYEGFDVDVARVNLRRGWTLIRGVLRKLR